MGYAKHINFISFQCISALTPWTGGSLRPPAPPSYLSTSCPLQHSSHPTNSLLNSTCYFFILHLHPPGSLPTSRAPYPSGSSHLLSSQLYSSLPHLLSSQPHSLHSCPLAIPSPLFPPSAPWYSSGSLSPGLPTSGPLPTFMAPYPPGSPPYSLGSLVPSGPLIHSPPPLRRSPAPPLPFHYLR